MKKKSIKSKMVWVVRCPHCGEETFGELRKGMTQEDMDRFCSVCGQDLCEAKYREEEVTDIIRKDP